MKRFVILLIIFSSSSALYGQAAKVNGVGPRKAVRQTQPVPGAENTFWQRQSGATAPSDPNPPWQAKAQTYWTESNPGNNPFDRTSVSGPEQVKLQSKIDANIRKYKASTDSRKKSEIEKEVGNLLSQQFDVRLKDPEARIKSSRKRLDDLKKQVKDRASMSDEIIDLRVKVLTHQAMGLGWGSVSRFGTAGYTVTYGSTFYPNWSGQMAAPYVANSFRPAGLNDFATPQFNNVPSGIPMSQQPAVQPQPNRTGTANNPFNRAGQNQKMKDDKPTVRQLLADFKAAENDNDRKPIVKELRAVLKLEFDNYQKQLNQSAERIETQISKLETNLEQRKKMKDSIVDLKLKTIINQANGLGF